LSEAEFRAELAELSSLNRFAQGSDERKLMFWAGADIVVGF